MAPNSLKKWTGLLTIALLLGAALVLAACGTTPPAETATPCPECPECPEAECPAPAVEVPYEEQWASSGHADATAEAFNHWNEDSPAEVPANCAACHATPGYLDYLGVDGSAAGVVDVASPIGTVVTCVTCHNAGTAALDSVTFPSGVVVSGLGDSARCMICHQGRAAGVTVEAAITDLGLADMDTVSADMRFSNIHYFAAAATLYGGQVGGGYQYEGNSYDYRFAHVEGYEECADCHNPHTLEVNVEQCAFCHEGVASVEDLRNVRMVSSSGDYDGDGDTAEGMAYEIEGLQALLYQAIQAYASEVAGAPIIYDAAAYPYFFGDANANGAVDEGEEGYASWTGRLLHAAYNYQLSIKDPGAYAHNGKYIVELLYDSIADLNTVLATPVDLSTAHREDAGHFAGSAEAWRHWDEDGAVEAGCARCHSATGLPLYIAEGVNVSEPLSNGMLCSTCHDEANWPARYAPEEIEFPSGATVTFENTDANLCLACHQGRQSTVSVNGRIGDAADDEVVEGLSFLNVHYFAAGASIFGGEVQGAYEYDGQTYAGRFTHVAGLDTCIGCHDGHSLGLDEEACAGCHAGAATPADIHMDTTDYDGDGDTTEGIAGEIATMQEALLVALQDYAANTAGTAIAYSATRYPYFLVDANANGVADPDEGDRYPSWTPRLLRAAYNYQYVAKDPGAFAHNATYIIQVLYDSLDDLGAAGGMTRP